MYMKGVDIGWYVYVKSTRYMKKTSSRVMVSEPVVCCASSLTVLHVLFLLLFQLTPIISSNGSSMGVAVPQSHNDDFILSQQDSSRLSDESSKRHDSDSHLVSLSLHPDAQRADALGAPDRNDFQIPFWKKKKKKKKKKKVKRFTSHTSTCLDLG